MKLSTEVQIQPAPWKIDYQTRLMTVGSCFAEVIGDELHKGKFQVFPSFFGTVYNPVSMAKLFRMAASRAMPHVGHYLKSEGNLFFHYDFHSSVYSDVSVDDLDGKIQRNLGKTRQLLQKTDVLIITLGSAFAYRFGKTNELITNCHKAPGREFSKELMPQAELLAAMEELLGIAKKLNPDIRVILTVSPVRHTRDTLQLNQVSKSLLRLVCHEMEQKHREVIYFPVYEIMMDELRDYRFYEPDLIHPDTVATDHIVRSFLKVFLNSDTFETYKEWQQVVQQLAHQPMYGYSAAYKKHLTQTLEKLRALKSRLDVDREIEEVDLIIKNHYSQTQ